MVMRRALSNILATLEQYKTANTPLYVWFLGLSGCGKSFILRQVSEFFKTRGVVGEYSDGAQMFYEIKKDVQQRFHKPTKEGFIVTDPFFDVMVVKKLMSSIQAFAGDYCLIEFSGGKDKLGRRNYSYQRINRVITKQVRDASAFLYISCPFDVRLKRNENRMTANEAGNAYKVDPDIMHRLFETDDFEKWREGIHRPVFVLNNSEEGALKMESGDLTPSGAVDKPAGPC